jgi:large subunit ribosomal protein L24
MAKFYIKRNDLVKVISGDDKGKTGRVLKVFPKEARIIVEKVNLIKRHLRKGHPSAPQGGIIEKEAPIHISNVMLVCTKCNKPTRVAKVELSDGSKVRKCKKCNEIIDKV